MTTIDESMMAVSPLSAYLGSFFGPHAAPMFLIVLAVLIHWFVFAVPGVVVLAFLDRKLTADIQMRIGPNRTPIAGFFQFVSDTTALMFKEDIVASSGGGVLVRWGPLLSITTLFAAMAAIPVSQTWALSNVDAGGVVALFSLMISNLMLFWVAYSKNEVWSVASAYRILPAIGTYIVPLVLVLLPPALIAGDANLDHIVRAQGGTPWRWIVFHNPGTILSFAAFFITVTLWLGPVQREQNLASGGAGISFYEGYSGLRRGILGFAEYLTMLVSLGLMVSLYLGGWRFPAPLDSIGRAADVVQWILFCAKSLFLGLVCIWIRGSIPRMRSDQMIALSWRILVPMELLGVIATAVWMVAFGGRGMGDFL